MTSTRRATAADIAAIANIYGSAFDDDPCFRWMAGVEKTRARLEPFWRKDVELALRPDDHLVYVTDDHASAAVWRGIDRWKGSPGESLALLPASVAAFRFRLPACIRLLMAMEKAHPRGPHYYLESLGTHGDHQGKGAGSAVLEPMLERCDTEGVPAYLESSTRRNVPFYVRHGFVETGFLDGPKSAPVITTMWREPKG